MVFQVQTMNDYILPYYGINNIMHTYTFKILFKILY
jgi:hypothetical protein